MAKKIVKAKKKSGRSQPTLRLYTKWLDLQRRLAWREFTRLDVQATGQSDEAWNRRAVVYGHIEAFEEALKHLKATQTW